jgi:hypothetical protein
VCPIHTSTRMHTHKIKNWKRVKHEHLKPNSREGVKITSCHNIRYIGPLKINMDDIWQYQICMSGYFWLTSLPSYPHIISEIVSNHKTRAKTWCTEKQMEKTTFRLFMYYREENNKDDIHTTILPVLHSQRPFISTSTTKWHHHFISIHTNAYLHLCENKQSILQSNSHSECVLFKFFH